MKLSSRVVDIKKKRVTSVVTNAIIVIIFITTASDCTYAGMMTMAVAIWECGGSVGRSTILARGFVSAMVMRDQNTSLS